jgi:LacI family repressor for deo operon, udp, cdd, tsx, nupC, and nupG
MTHTIRDIARLSGFSTATVSRAFSAPQMVSETTRKRVQEVAETLDYQPNAIARSMALQRTEKIAFLICKKRSSILDEFYAGVCEGIMQETNLSDYQLLVSTAEDWAVAKRKQVDGVILGGNASLDLISEFRSQNVKIVLANHEVPGLELPCVVSDEEGGVRSALEYLIAKGHYKIGMLAGRFSPYISERRYAAFRSVMEEHGLSLDPSFIRMVEPDIESATRAAMALLSPQERPTAVFGANDVIAAGVIKAAHHLHLRIPQDVAVIGCDDSRLCRVVEPELASIHISCVRMGSLAARQLLSLLAGEPVLPQRTVVPTDLCIRSSV